MNVYYSTADARGKIKNPVVTTGSFDGVHVGHKVIINRLNQIAGDIGGESVLITFHPHPRKVLYPEQKDLKLINSQEEKVELLRKAGLNNLIILPFSVEFSKTSSHDFIAKVLINELQAKVIVVGHNHHFGHNRQGDYTYLHTLSQQLGFTVEEIALQDIENETVSSTKIRKALFEGNIQRANAYLDHQYIIYGDILPESKMFQHLAAMVVSVHISEEEKLIPPAGVYATNLKLGDKWLKSMTVIADNGTIPHVYSLLIYDKLPAVKTSATLYFYKKVAEPDSTAIISAESLLRAKDLVEDLIY